MRSSDGLKVGVVGLGFIGPAHVEALRRLGIEVVGFFDSRPEQVADKIEAMRIDNDCAAKQACPGCFASC